MRNKSKSESMRESESIRAQISVAIFLLGSLTVSLLADLEMMGVFAEWGVPGIPLFFVWIFSYCSFYLGYLKGAAFSLFYTLLLWYALFNPFNGALLVICVCLAYYVYLGLTG